MKSFHTVILLLALALLGALAAQWMAGTDRDLGEVFIRFAGYDLHTNVPRAAEVVDEERDVCRACGIGSGTCEIHGERRD